MKFKEQIQNLLLRVCTKRRFEKEVWANYGNPKLLGHSNIYLNYFFAWELALIDHFSTLHHPFSPLLSPISASPRLVQQQILWRLR